MGPADRRGLVTGGQGPRKGSIPGVGEETEDCGQRSRGKGGWVLQLDGHRTESRPLILGFIP